MIEKLEKKNNLVIDLIYLTKPKVMSLLLMAALAGVFIGSESSPSFKVIIGVFLGGMFASGGSGAINMGIEKNIDININQKNILLGIGGSGETKRNVQKKDL